MALVLAHDGGDAQIRKAFHFGRAGVLFLAANTFASLKITHAIVRRQRAAFASARYRLLAECHIIAATRCIQLKRLPCKARASVRHTANGNNGRSAVTLPHTAVMPKQARAHTCEGGVRGKGNVTRRDAE